MFSYSLSPDGGSGFAAISDRFAALVADSSPAAVAELYALMLREESTIDDLLDAASTRSIGDFAIVELLSASPVAVALAASGRARVEIDGASSTTIEGPPGATWVIGQATEINSIVMTLGRSVDAPVRLPIARGVVPADSILIDQTAVLATTVTPSAQPATVPITLPQLDRAAQPEPRKALVDAPRNPAVQLELPDGNRLTPTAPVLLGRRPWDTATADQSRLHVTADSPERQISARHLLLEVTGDEVVARDLFSTNGTIVLRLGRPPRLLHDGRSTVIHAGDVLDLGENFRVSIVRD